MYWTLVNGGGGCRDVLVSYIATTTIVVVIDVVAVNYYTVGLPYSRLMIELLVEVRGDRKEHGGGVEWLEVP